MPNLSLEHLRKRSEFLRVTKGCDSWVTPAFIIQLYKRAPEGPFRYGITASRKVGGAVERNRAKRRLRALLRQVLPLLGSPGNDYVLIARKEVLRRDFFLMCQEFEHALAKLHGKKHEEGPPS